MIDLDHRINWESFYSRWIKIDKFSGDHAIVLCPFHQDKHPSFNINMKTGQYKCHSCNETGNAYTFLEKHQNMTKEQAKECLMKEAGIEPNEPLKKKKPRFTVAEYCRAKKLDEDLVRSYGVTDGRNGVRIPYMDESGSIVSTRHRHSLDGSMKFSWTKGSKTMPYGQWKLQEARTVGEIVLVEGESDCHTLWQHGIPAMGFPGASTFNPAWSDCLRGLRLYIHKEPDAGGETFAKKIMQGLARVRWQEDVFLFGLVGYKDPSSLHCENPDGFKDKWRNAIAAARPVDVVTETIQISVGIPGAPELRTPAGWRVTAEKGLEMETKEGFVQISRTPLFIRRELRNIDNPSEQKYELTFLKNNAWHDVRTLKSTVAQSRTITSLSDRGILVDSNNASKMVGYLTAVASENQDILPEVRSISRMGWIDSKRFIPGVCDDVVLDIDPSSASLAGGYSTFGEKSEWVDMAKCIRKYTIPRFFLAASFGSPLLKILSHRVFIVHSWGPSKGGKTAMLKAALSVWGHPDTLMTSFNATKVGLEKIASFYADLPLGIDERQVAGDKQGFIEGLVYLLGMGKGKTRGTKTGGVSVGQAWRVIALTTGEQPLSEDSSQTGIRTRAIELWGAPIPTEIEARKFHKQSGLNYGFAGPEFIKMLITKGQHEVAEEHDQLVALLEKSYSNKAGPHITAVALVGLADLYASRWIFGLNENTAYDEMVELIKNIMDIIEDSDSTDYTTKALEWIHSWIVQHIVNFKQNFNEKYGEIRGDLGEIHILPSALEPDLRKAGFNPRRVYQELLDREILVADKDTKRYKKTVRIEGQAVKAIVLKTSAFADEKW